MNASKIDKQIYTDLSTGDNKIQIKTVLIPINESESLNIINFSKLLEDYENDNSKNPAEIIIKNLINNFKIYMKIIDAELRLYKYVSINELDSFDDTLYIKSIDDLFRFSFDSKNIFLCCLNDILIKLKLNMDIIITNLVNANNKNTFNYFQEECKPDINSRTKYIKIGYINDESKLYNKSLNKYDKNELYNLIKLIKNSILENKSSYYYIESNNKMSESLYDIFERL